MLSYVKDGLGLPCGTEALGAAAREPLAVLYVCGSLVCLSCMETEISRTYAPNQYYLTAMSGRLTM